ncbi:uncharacterized protein RCC_01328 [Ramularia collo-cygni]|uniref:DUF1772 domain-containing protein n=1 Tax=Ramularia collo-cygni TaxID=112498 RepID=A0A2D3UMM1_9PEZI|nr:uncharacterized protein RCC_01328 [Ramularia collo-cygni]CZT15471.1 uncharacterized protein RCC_01328 [Ramularia collo-cygni]
MILPAAVTVALPWLQWGIIIALAFVSGIAWCFIGWVVPIIKLNTNSKTAAAQLVDTAYRGGIWLEPFNAALAATLGLMSIALRYHPDPVEAASWKFFAGASFTLLQVAWWERVFIFPLDDAVMAIRDTQDRKSAANGLSEQKKLADLHRMLDAWAVYHSVRATLPFVAAMVALTGKFSVLASW